jgi:DNA-binding Lrp family transcriptional regulator
MIRDPRATVVALADRVGLSRNTVQARLTRFDSEGTLSSVDHRVDPAALGYPLTCFINIQVIQRQLAEVGDALAAIPEVVEVSGLSGAWDLLARVVARDADDLYRIAGQILAIPGVVRTESSLVMRPLVDYRLTPLIIRAAEST